MQETVRAAPDLRMTVRPHPRLSIQENRELRGRTESSRIEPPESATAMADFVFRHDIIVGAYSMGLLVARQLGRPAVSFQPVASENRFREEIFAAWGIPVVQRPAHLAPRIREAVRSGAKQRAINELVFQRSQSVETISCAVLEMSAAASQPLVGVR
jgi:hypothetical protein